MLRELLRPWLRSLPPSLLLAGILFSTFMLARPADAQGQGQVHLAAQAGLGGYCKEEKWVPIRAVVENNGPDLQARLQVSYQIYGGGQAISAADLSLPGSSRKELFLYIRPQAYLTGLSVSLRSADRELTRTDLKLTCLSGGDLFIGLIADDPDAYGGPLQEIQPLKGMVRVSPLKISDLPDLAQGWSALDALVISGVDTGKLSSQQRQAMQSWLAEGGRLLVIGGAKWQAASAGLGGLLPLEVSSTRTVGDLSQLQSYLRSAEPLQGEAVVAAGTLQPDSDVMLSQDGIPLLIQKPIGLGKVYYLAVDPAMLPLKDWEGMKDLYGHLLGAQPPRPSWLTNPWDADFADQALSTLPELGLPAVSLICVLLAIYVAVIGPLHYLVLRRFKRRELAWFTIPGLVVLFTFLSYVAGFLFRGTQPILNRLSVIQAWDGQDQARVRALVGVYSPGRARYTMEADRGVLFSPYSNSQGLHNNTWLTLDQGSKSLTPDLPVEIGGMLPVVADGSLPALAIHHNLTINLDNANPRLTGAITNAGGFTLKDAILVTSGDWSRLGDLAPGQSKNVRLELVPDPGGPGFYSIDASSIFNPGSSNFRLSGSEDERRRMALFESALAQDYGTMNEGNWGVYLMGWLDQPPLPVGLQKVNFKAVDTQLYIAMLSPSIHSGPGPLELTSSLFSWESSSEAYTPFGNPYYNREVPPDGYILRFRLAIPLHFSRVTWMSLSMESDDNPGDVQASLWDYPNGRWARVQGLHWGNMDIPDAVQYVGPDGEVQLKVEGDSGSNIVIDSSTISLVVEP